VTDADRRSEWSGFRKVDVQPPQTPSQTRRPSSPATPRPTRRASRRAPKEQVAPAASPAAVTEEAPAPAAPAPTTGPPSPTAVWIAADQLEYLRSQATDQATTKTQVFLDCFEVVYEQLKAEGPATQPRKILPQRPPRRRGRVEGGSPASLYLTPAEREVIDGLATQVGLTRSALVSRVIDRARRAPAQGSTQA
jgi:hypothetical protein